MNNDLESMSLVDLFDALLQPDAPPAVSMWPQTAGWLWLLFAVVSLFAIGFWRWLRWRRETAYRRAALKELEQAGDDPAVIAAILKRTALAGFDRERVAGLYGADWLSFLDATCAGSTFSGSDAGRVLALASYTTQNPDPRLPILAADWIRSHRNRSDD